ncbi:argF [Symbiodinium microadriaticum]|nr:argF [Symbiodinium microadriaticum]
MSSMQRPTRSVSACPCSYRFQTMCCLALISTGAITASWSQIQQFTWQGNALLDSARIPLPDNDEGGKDIEPDFPPDIVDEEAAADFGNGSAEEQAARRSRSRSSSEEVPDGPDDDPRGQTEDDQEHTGVFNLDEVEDESHGATPAKKVRHDDGRAPTTLLGIYQELCRMGLRSPGAIRLASPELRDAVVRLYQPLVERRPPAAFHPERMVTLKSPNCKDPAWKHILDGTRRAVPRALVDVTTGMGGGPELDLLELRLWEINASLGDQPKPAIKPVVVTCSLSEPSARRPSNLGVPDMEDWLLKNDNATSFLYKHEERRLGYQPSDPPAPSASRTARHVLTMCDLSREEVMDILRVAAAMKESRRTYLDTGYDRFSETLKGYSLLTLFEKPSLRTRVSLEVGMNQLGGQAIFYSIADSPLGVKESIQEPSCVSMHPIHFPAWKLVVYQRTPGKCCLECVANSGFGASSCTDTYGFSKLHESK